MTSEHSAIGPTDADAAWMGVRRHQAFLAVVGVVLVGDGVMRRGPLIELLVGVIAFVGAVPAVEGRTAGEYAVVVLRFLARRHWREFTVREFGLDVMLWSKGEVSFRGYRLRHRGRLDLSGRDVALAEALATLVDAASAARGPRHISQHVRHDGEGVATLLAIPTDLAAPDGWVLDNELALAALGIVGESTSHCLERFSYVRTAAMLARVYRVRDFSAVPHSRALLEQLLRSPSSPDVSLHIDVVSGASASRRAARAVHRVDSDDASARAVGFRRSARSAKSIERLTEREILVAEGRALVRVAVFVIVRAESMEALRDHTVEIWRHAHDAGLRLERGRGVQARWYQAQLPGGVNW